MNCTWHSRIWNKKMHIRMLFIDFAFNTTIPKQLTEKLKTLGFNTTLCNWIPDFLTGRPVSQNREENISEHHTEHRLPLGPFLFTPLTHNSNARVSSNHIINFADDTTMVSLITNDDDSLYREEVDQLTRWCKNNNLSLNAEKTKEMVLDYRRSSSEHPPLIINGTVVERVNSTKFLGLHIADDITWSTNTTAITQKAQQPLYFLQRLKRPNPLPQS